MDAAGRRLTLRRAGGGVAWTRLPRPLAVTAWAVLTFALLCATSQVTAAAPASEPKAQPDAYSTPYETRLSIGPPGVLANDSDPEGDSLLAILVTKPGRGTLDLDPDGSFTYEPPPAFQGATTFTYAATDGTSVSLSVNVRIDVLPKPSPTPTPAPTPTPTPTPTSAPTPTTVPSVLPTSTPPPLPSASVLPEPSASPLPSPQPSRSPSPPPPSSPGPSPSPFPGSSGSTTGGSGGAGGSGPIDAGPAGDSPIATTSTGAVWLEDGALAIVAAPAGSVEMSSSLGDVADLAVEWVVPTVVLTVPGVLVMLAVAGQALGAAIFIPLTRRSLGGFGLSAVRGRGRRPGRF